MDTKKRRAIIAASVAGLMAVTSLAGINKASAKDIEVEPCYGINTCKGAGAYGGKGHSCAGKNGCKGQGFIEVPKDSCMKIQGGTLKAEA